MGKPSGPVASAVVVVPCFDEAHRFDADAFVELARRPGTGLVLVDDGSTDGTADVLDAVAARAPGAIEVVRLGTNGGKGEAVRRGLLLALDRGAELVGYLDADLSTPIDEMDRLIEQARAPGVSVVLGSRVAMLGARIDRSAVRHYFGRAFATGASLVLRLPVYDTQCGAKVFRRSDGLRAALSTPFASRWAFDVELLGRLVVGCPGVAPTRVEEILEVPLRRWRHVPGSKLHPPAMIRAAVELALIDRQLAGLRRARSGP
jgi:glycosyltransferase involved in cell wall biosynthesis